MGKKTGWAAVVAGIALLALVVVLAVARPWASESGQVAEPTPTPEPPPPAVLTGYATDPPMPTNAGIRAAINDLVNSDELGEVSAAVIDVVTDEILYDHDAASLAIPASTIKLVTAATVLASLGPAHQLPTVVLAGEEPGEVVLVGGGDPTLTIADDGFYPGAARLDTLAEQVQAAVGDHPIETVTVDSGLFTGPVHGPWDDDIPGGGFVGPITALMIDGGRIDPDPAPAQRLRASARWSEPELAAGEAFAKLLGLEADAVASGSAPPPVAVTTGATPTPGATAAAQEPAADPVAPGTELGRVDSPPMLRLVEIMLADSDNVLAEALARQVALAMGEPASFTGAAEAMTAVLPELGIDLGAGVIADGSGLSRDNEVTAAMLTELLRLAAAAPGEPGDPLAGMFAGLPVAGWSGTLVDRYAATGVENDAPAATEPGAGVVRAKTGSLRGVHGLAGLVVTADGRVLAFALLANEAPAAPEQARRVLDEIASELAGCGCR